MDIKINQALVLHMKVNRNLLLILVAVVLFAGGLWYDIDYCEYTSESITTIRLFGIPLKQTRHSGFRPWLDDEIGLEVDSNFVDYMSAPVILPLASTPPGNWLNLRRAKQIYDDFPLKREQVSQVLLRLESRMPPLLNRQDRIDLGAIAKNAEQEAGENASRPTP